MADETAATALFFGSAPCNSTCVVSPRPTVRWARHLADDIDPVVVERLCAGQHVESYTTYERREAVRRLRSARRSIADIARLLGINERQVCRDLASLGFSPGDHATVLARAAARRPLVARLAAAGVRAGEISRLLGYPRHVISKDITWLGCAADRRSLPCRPLAELRRRYGHLLDDAERAA